nr:hypothetical protein [Streptomyces sp.]
MDVPTLILLGAAGGLLRGVLDAYTRFVSWQADRRAHRQLAAAGAAQGESPKFQVYFDPSVDAVAAVVHSVMGAGTAVLFGTTGQISGEYAALVVGLSAPMLLTQLGRIQTVNEAVTGDRQAAGAAEPAAEAAAPQPAADAMGAGGADGPGAAAAPSATAAVARPAPPPPTDPASTDTVAAPPEGPPPPARPTPSPRQPVSFADARTPEPAGDEPAADRTRLPNPTRPGDPSLPGDPSRLADPAEGAGPGLDGRGTPRWRQGPAIGEEGL